MWDNGLLAFCIVLGLVLLFNAGLFYAFRHPSARSSLLGLREGIRRARNSLKVEEQSLAELRAAVDRLRERRTDQDG